MATELEYRKELRRLGPNSYEGWISIGCPDNEAISTMLRWVGRGFPGAPVLGCPVVRKPNIVFHPNGEPGVARIDMHFRTPGRGREIRPGVARLTTDTTKAMSLKLDADKNQILGEKVSTATESHGNVIIRTLRLQASVVERPALVVLETAWEKNQEPISRIMALSDTVNNQQLPKFGNAGEETLLFIGAQRQQQALDEFSYKRYHMLFNPHGWNTNIVDQYLVQVVQKVPVLDVKGVQIYDDKDKPETRDMERVIPDVVIDAKGKMVKHDRPEHKGGWHPTADWSVLHAMEVWY